MSLRLVKMKPDKCEACGGELEYRREGSVQGLYCKNCDWALVTTYIAPIELDETKCKIRIASANCNDDMHVKAVSAVSGLNLIQARKLLRQDNPIVFEGVAIKILKARDALIEAGLSCEISPLFNY